MDKLVIHGKNPLSGTVDISGAKNAVLPMMTAALLTEGVTTIHKVPDLRDTRTMIRLLKIIGAGIEFIDGTIKIDSSTVNKLEAPYDLVKTMRASFYVMGPLLGRFGEVKVSLPGGCAWGPRPVDFHLMGMQKLGADVSLEQGYILAKGLKLKGTNICFDFPSVGATGNVVMAAVLAEGTTVIENAAREPDIVQLCEMLNMMGANITGLNTNTLTIEGVRELHSAEITVIPDRIETGTFLMAGAALGNITLNHAEPNHLQIVLDKLEECGARYKAEHEKIHIQKADEIKAVDITTEVYPGFPTDLQAQWIALMCAAKGQSIVTDTVYHDRFTHIPELNRLGAHISLHDNIATVAGDASLKGAQVMSTDIRASASLILGGLMAEGQTDVSRIYHIDRGYEKIEEKFRSIGADISRISE
ncbi:MAG TPA: UDP-N-acetylglucosamine 1-carboxyvinyltransferase [Candidatus Marinimicrobia bacterium]|jgi:UDP-N-acetylglucosamine 1-carboxyvinyltransferase|nr:UDP-N-acetylglucosamine 1-carboxyvinyltransferase [Candidatus Neomarinimicrobiota bacterium]HBN44845.1 UDP-N-acetylglucosamine 1-carboxyvinyltransferase [Candidatus Neomarinimicrobiota bacterium]HJL73731.1 UDP-N-acetylglucosamine 1-carboxyvinyltransferase [Candidatus Neomarinimicrobiota bacterium]HJM69724.1 UDP-N-acetylglucosamine 1-carboxyvinyltransferase [Candidatus Neomarinimicrobiota bacterium]|tara:strand:+ start:5542 stop:6792 length:1251 start_codon:yes stop_codon:yes gene_type:complete